MKLLRPLLVLLGCVASALSDDSALRRLGGTGTYDGDNTFRSECKSDEVVLVTEATFEQTGDGIKCEVTPPPGGNKCVRDVRSHVDEKCSGWQSCQFVLREQCRTWNVTCDGSSVMMLKMSYDCLKVVSRDCDQQCGSNDQLTKLTSPEGYLASLVTSAKRCGSSQCPWVIQVLPGQAINVTLLDFSGTEKKTVSRGARPSGSEGGCVNIKEKANPKEVVECVGKSRERHLYSTVSNTLELRLNVKESKFLIYYQAIGCPDIVPPRNSRMKRTGNECEIDCPGTDLKWVVTCEENKWVGADSIGKCPGGAFGPAAPAPNPQQSESSFSLPTGILIAVVVALTVIIAVLVLTIGFVCLKKHQYETKLSEPVLYGAPCSEFEFCDEFSNMHRPGAPKTGTSTTRSRAMRPSTDLRDNTYAADQQFEMQPLQPLQRPLPSIPVDGRCGSWRPNDPRRIVVQLHPTNSGSGTMSIIQPYPTMMARDGRLPCNCGSLKAHPSQGSVYRPQSHLYFTLDPEVQVEEPATPAEAYPSLGRNCGGAENQTINRVQQRALMGPQHGNTAADGEAIHVNPQDLVPLNLTNRSKHANQANQMQAANQYPSNRIRADEAPMNHHRLPENQFPMNLSFDAQQNLQQKRNPPPPTATGHELNAHS